MREIKRTASVVAVENCELYRLDRADFMREIWPYPDMLSKIEQIASDRIEVTKQLDDGYRQRMKSTTKKTGEKPTEGRKSLPGKKEKPVSSGYKRKPRGTGHKAKSKFINEKERKS